MNTEKIKKEVLITLKDHTIVRGIVYIKEYYKHTTKMDKEREYLVGSLDVAGSLKFLVWESCPCFHELETNNYEGQTVEVLASVSYYEGELRLILIDAFIIGSVCKNSLSFIQCYSNTKYYNTNLIWSRLLYILSRNLSSEGYKIFTSIMNTKINNQTTISDRFKVEYASINHHDNCEGGLLAHSERLCEWALIHIQHQQFDSTLTNDELLLGAVLHDIGKVLEFKNGTSTKKAEFQSHTALGKEILEYHKELIVSLKDQHFYDSLVSVVLQHNGSSSSERPRTVLAGYIRKLDQVDAGLTSFSETLVKSKGNDRVWIDGRYLTK